MKTREWSNGRWNSERLANGMYYAQAWAAAVESTPQIIAEGSGVTEQEARADLYVKLARFLRFRNGETITNDQGWLLPPGGQSERELREKGG